MAINFATHKIKHVLKNKRKIVGWINEVIFKHDRKIGNILIVLANDKYILQLNKEYLKHNYYTDIITFDYSNEGLIEGDIFISIDTVLSNSNFYKTKYDEELLRVIIHGILHLLGYNDKSKEEKSEMRKKENECLDLYFRRNE